MFFDNASTTQIDLDILKQFEKLNDEYFYNPGGLYTVGRNVKLKIDEYRNQILTSLNGSGKIIFTGSASEANNLAIFGFIKKNTRKILTSMGEHPSIYNTFLELKNRGYSVEFVNLNKDGSVDIDDYKLKMTDNVDIVSVMHVSNETGAINDIATLVEYAKDINPNVIFHSDGVQAVGKIPVDIDELGVDLYSMSAHKIHGMKGVGALYFKDKLNIKPIIFGGGQEFGLRSGTENILGIYSLYKSIEKATTDLEINYEHVTNLKNRFIQLIESSGLDFKINSNANCSPYIISIGFNGCRAETILNMMSDKQIFIGNGSACSSKKMGNRILENIGIDKQYIMGNLRISFSKFNTLEEVDILADTLSLVVKEYKQKV